MILDKGIFRYMGMDMEIDKVSINDNLIIDKEKEFQELIDLINSEELFE